MLLFIVPSFSDNLVEIGCLIVTTTSDIIVYIDKKHRSRIHSYCVDRMHGIHISPCEYAKACLTWCVKNETVAWGRIVDHLGLVTFVLLFQWGMCAPDHVWPKTGVLPAIRINRHIATHEVCRKSNTRSILFSPTFYSSRLFSLSKGQTRR